MTSEHNANAVIDDLVPAVYVGMYVCACVGMCTYSYVRMCAKCAYTVLQYCIQCVQLFVVLVVLLLFDWLVYLFEHGSLLLSYVCMCTLQYQKVIHQTVYKQNG